MTTMNPWRPTTDELQLRRLGKLLEELGELTAVASRCVIQGIDEIDPSSGEVNRQRLEDEMGDVYAQLHCTMKSLDLDCLKILKRNLRKRAYMKEWDDLVS
jgi:NTP pyrophosphatase (non-canonical NTP hydrolase)